MTCARRGPPGRRRRRSASPRASAGATSTNDKWLLNHMIHNLTPTPTRVYITYDIDFIPARRRAAHGHARGPDAVDGRHGRQRLPGLRRDRRAPATAAAFTFPDDAPNAYGGGPPRNTLDRRPRRHARRHRRPPAPRRPVRRPDGHARRAHRRGSSARRAHYYEPAGAVSWDVSMTATPPELAGGGQEGRRARRSRRTYDTRTRVVVRVDGRSCRSRSTRGRAPAAPTRSPRTSTVKGVLTHGHLPENDHHGGGARRACPTPRKLSRRPARADGRHQGLRLRRRAT